VNIDEATRGSWPVFAARVSRQRGDDHLTVMALEDSGE
jgi:hypothetical protein